MCVDMCTLFFVFISGINVYVCSIVCPNAVSFVVYSVYPDLILINLLYFVTPVYNFQPSVASPLC